MMTGETMLRVGNVRSEAELEIVRDILDEIGANYEHVRSEPEYSYPQTAYFYVSVDVSHDVDNLLSKLSEKHGFDVEIF
jgi:hypothetical protein